MLTWKHSGMVQRVLRDQKDFRSTHIDYISTDLDYKILCQRLGARKMCQVLPKV